MTYRTSGDLPVARHPADRGAAQFGGHPHQRGQAVVELAIVAPVLLLLVLAIGDFARLYTSQMTVESAAREAADFGAFLASNWSDGTNASLTENEMVRRACTAASTLPDYVATGDATTMCSAPGSNPLFSYQMEDGTIGAAIDPVVGACGDPATDPPCMVHVTMAYTYHTFLNVPWVYPATLSLERASRFAISDFGPPE